MEEIREELPNFSIGIDLLGPVPTRSKNKAEKNSQVARFANLSEDLLQQIWPKVWKAITFLCGHSLLHDVVSPLCDVVLWLCDVVSSLCAVVSPLRDMVSSLYDGFHHYVM